VDERYNNLKWGVTKLNGIHFSFNRSGRFGGERPSLFRIAIMGSCGHGHSLRYSIEKILPSQYENK